MFNSFWFSTFLWEQKVNIAGSLFLGLAIYSYFYEKSRIKKEIFELKKQAVRFEIIKNNLIDTIMSDQERYTIKEIVSNMASELRGFKSEIREDIKDLISEFHDYKVSNNERISLLEGNQKITTKTIALYVSIGLAFIMLAINTYMSVRG